MSKIQTVYISFLGIELAIEGIYHSGLIETPENPAEPAEFEIYKIIAGGVDITDLVNEDLITDIETAILNN